MSHNQIPTLSLPVFRGQAEEATYQDPLIPPYRGNPLIEALPPILNVDGSIKILAYDPGYDEQHRTYPSELRLHLIQNIVHFFEPLPVHLDLEQRFSRMIRVGYQARNPIKPDFWPQTQKRVQTLRQNVRLEQRLRSTAVGFSILGISGVGKTTAVESILSLYPQVIFHNHYRDQDFTWVQVVWLKLECPFDGSTKGLCLNFFQAIDSLLGTNYYQNYTRRGQATTDEMLPQMAQVASLHSIGVLVIDELQHLSKAKSGGSEKMLNFFVQLVNTIGMPVVLVGTYKAISLLTGEFRQARRGTGQGDLVWDRMEEDEVWDVFVEALWRYQYVRHPHPLTPPLSHVLYDVSQGITDFAVKAYLLGQIRAIASGEEMMTESIIRSVATDSFRLANPVLSALRRGDTETLYQVDDVHPIDLEPYLQTALRKVQLIGRLATVNTVKDKIAETSTNRTNNGTLKLATEKAEQPDKNGTSGGTSSKQKTIPAQNDLREVVSLGQKNDIAAYQALMESSYIRSAVEFLEGDMAS